MERTAKKELKKELNDGSMEYSRAIFCPICGKRIIWTCPKGWKVCSDRNSGLHIIFFQAESRKITVEAAWDGKRKNPD